MSFLVMISFSSFLLFNVRWVLRTEEWESCRLFFCTVYNQYPKWQRSQVYWKKRSQVGLAMKQTHELTFEKSK